EARHRIVARLGELGLSTYAYAPKSDPYHRARWWEALPLDELRRFERLTVASKDAGVELVYGVAPQRLFGGRSNLFTGGAERASEGLKKLHHRCASLARVGVLRFMLQFDDTWATVLPRFSSHEGGR